MAARCALAALFRVGYLRRAGLPVRRLAVLAAGLALGGVLAACETGSYPLDIFPEMHYQQSYRTQEPPLVVAPEGQVPTTGAELPLTDFVATLALANPRGSDPAAIDEGRQLFATNCAMCHGAGADGISFVADRFTAAGEKSPPSLRTDSVRQQPDGSLFWTITNGVNRMPSWQPLLTANERWALVAYLRSLS